MCAGWEENPQRLATRQQSEPVDGEPWGGGCSGNHLSLLPSADRTWAEQASGGAPWSRVEQGVQGEGVWALGEGRPLPPGPREEVGCPLCRPFWADPFACSRRFSQCRKARLFSPLQPSHLNGRAVAGGSLDCRCKKRRSPRGPHLSRGAGGSTPGWAASGPDAPPLTLLSSGWRTPLSAVPVA